jgi:hypothetical protein
MSMVVGCCAPLQLTKVRLASRPARFGVGLRQRGVIPLGAGHHLGTNLTFVMPHGRRGFGTGGHGYTPVPPPPCALRHNVSGLWQ